MSTTAFSKATASIPSSLKRKRRTLLERDYSYISAELKPEYVEEIFAKLLEANVAPPKYDLHCTLVYDERKHDKPLAVMDPRREFRAHLTKLEHLGDGYVFHMSSKDLSEEFRRLKEAGYEHSFVTPLHHMSITYDPDKYDVLALDAAFSDWLGKELVFWKADYGFKKP